MRNRRNVFYKGSFFSTQRKLIVIMLIFFMSSSAYSQNSLVTQTLEKARTLRNDKKFAEAAEVLGTFEKQYPGNIWIERLFAQTLYWMHDFQQSETIYQRALQYHPKDLDLKYEYALLLFSMKKYDPATKLLLDYTNSPKDNGGAEGLLGKIYYYQKNFRGASTHLKKALQYNPDNKEFNNLYQKVYRIVSPNLSVGGVLRSDNQPMNVFGLTARFQWYRSSFLNFSISGNYMTYNKIPTTNSISTVQVSNLFRLGSGGSELRLSFGQSYSGLTKSQDWNGGISLLAQLGKAVAFKAEAQRLNYDNTESSVGDLLMMNQYSLALIAGKQDNWNGIAGAQTQYYPDNNYVSAFYAWFLSKPLDLSGAKLSFGYAFNYMDSKEDRFEIQTIYYQTHGMGRPTTLSATQGIYVPYFTPHHQFSNSLLANFSAELSPASTFYAHASVGFYSKTNAPYFVQQNTTTEKVFSNQTYYPLDMGASFHFDLSRSATLRISYDYQKTYYFNSNNLNLAFRIYF